MHRAGSEAPLTFSPRYAPPEVLQAFERGSRTAVVDAKADMWSLGVVAYELLTAAPAFPPYMKFPQLVDAIVGRTPLPWEGPRKNEQLGKLRMLKRSLVKCLSRNPAQRPTADALLASWNEIFDYFPSATVSFAGNTAAAGNSTSAARNGVSTARSRKTLITPDLPEVREHPTDASENEVTTGDERDASIMGSGGGYGGVRRWSGGAPPAPPRARRASDSKGSTALHDTTKGVTSERGGGTPGAATVNDSAMASSTPSGGESSSGGAADAAVVAAPVATSGAAAAGGGSGAFGTSSGPGDGESVTAPPAGAGGDGGHTGGSTSGGAELPPSTVNAPVLPVTSATIVDANVGDRLMRACTSTQGTATSTSLRTARRVALPACLSARQQARALQHSARRRSPRTV